MNFSSFSFTVISLFVQFLRQVYGKHNNFVTCGSVVKLLNKEQRVRIHSHEVKYGSGSGQQSVTGVDNGDDHNSHWAIRGKNDTACKRGEPIKCDDVIRLYHVNTNCYLHSHLFASPLTSNQEVSCFVGANGEGDTGDYWVVQCVDSSAGGVWTRTADVRLKHRDTNGFLATSGKTYGRPISGQHEVVCLSRLPRNTASVDWVTREGVYVQPSDDPSPAYQDAEAHTEL